MKNRMKNRENKIKIYGTIVGVILFILLALGFAYAYLSWRSDTVNIAGNTECFNINYAKGENISAANIKLYDESAIINDGQITIASGMVYTNVSVGIDSNCNISGKITLNLNVTSLSSAFTTGNSIGAFKYAVVSYSTAEYPDISGEALEGISFPILVSDTISSTSKIELLNTTLDSDGTMKNYLIIFYIDGDLAMNDAAGNNFTASIEAVATQIAQ